MIRKITNTATNSHYESLSFLTSAGAWDSAGKRFVFPGIAKGEPVLTIVDVDRGSTEREIRLSDVHEVVNPTWSPDGKQIAFSGLIGGFNDLFVYDLGKDDKAALRRLTTDAYAEMDPAWSPDGKQLAFSTDRFTTNLETIKSGRPRLALMDVATGAVRELGGFAERQEHQPAVGRRRPLDLLPVGSSGDHEHLPHRSRRRQDDAAHQHADRRERHHRAQPGDVGCRRPPRVQRLRRTTATTSTRSTRRSSWPANRSIELPRNAAVLPPRRDADGLVVEALKDPTWGLPGTEVPIPEGEPYKPKWGLDFAGQPSFGVGVDPFGTYATGGVSFLFSDMLGNHVIGTAAQVTSRFDEFGGTLFYLNRTHRWNWGASLDQTPYVSRGYDAGFVGNTYVEHEYSLPAARPVR